MALFICSCILAWSSWRQQLLALGQLLLEVRAFCSTAALAWSAAWADCSESVFRSSMSFSSWIRRLASDSAAAVYCVGLGRVALPARRRRPSQRLAGVGVDLLQLAEGPVEPHVGLVAVGDDVGRLLARRRCCSWASRMACSSWTLGSARSSRRAVRLGLQVAPPPRQPLNMGRPYQAAVHPHADAPIAAAASSADSGAPPVEHGAAPTQLGRPDQTGSPGRRARRPRRRRWCAPAPPGCRRGGPPTSRRRATPPRPWPPRRPRVRARLAAMPGARRVRRRGGRAPRRRAPRRRRRRRRSAAPAPCTPKRSYERDGEHDVDACSRPG